MSGALCFDMIRPICLVISCDSAFFQSYLIKDRDGNGIDFYVLPPPLISKISLELVKKSDSITFQVQTRVTWFMLWHKKVQGRRNWTRSLQLG